MSEWISKRPEGKAHQVVQEETEKTSMVMITKIFPSVKEFILWKMQSHWGALIGKILFWKFKTHCNRGAYMKRENAQGLETI